MAYSPTERTLVGTNDDAEETTHSQTVDPLIASNSHGHVPQEENRPEPVNLDPMKLKLDLNAEDQHASDASMLEGFLTMKSCLSPLAARAALASRVSTACDGENGTTLDDHQVTKNVSVVGRCSAEDPSTLDPVIAETVNVVRFLDENESLKPQLEESLEVIDSSSRSKCSTKERRSPECTKTSSVTCSSIVKTTSVVTNEEKMQMDAKDIPRRSSMNSEGSALPSASIEIGNSIVKDGAEKAKLTQITKSGNSKRSKLKKSIWVRRNKKNHPKWKLERAPLLRQLQMKPLLLLKTIHQLKVTNNLCVLTFNVAGKVKSAKRKSIEPPGPGRVTRSATQKAAGNEDIDSEMKSCDEEVKGRVSKKTRRSSRSPELAKKYSPVPQDLEEESILAKKKELVSLPMDSEDQTPTIDKAKTKVSSSSKKARQTEGKLADSKRRDQNRKPVSTGSKSRDQKRKSPFTSEQERRFSHRLAFLPRTRSQVKH